MQIFELHFNPESKEGLIFDSFCYEAENIFEKRVGNLYMVGSLKNSILQNSRLLDRLAKTIKERFYGFSAHSPESALREGLKKANEFLEKIAREGDVSWLGNLNFVVISLKNFDLNFTKVGNLKILLLRNGQIMDIDKNVDLQGIEPYPLKIFSNIIVSSLAEEDKILILTDEVFKAFSSENILNKIAESISFEEKELKKILKQKEEKLLNIAGTCLIIKITKENKSMRPYTIKKEYEKFSVVKIFTGFGRNITKNIILTPKRIIKILSPVFAFKNIKGIKIKPKTPVIKIPNPVNKIKNINLRNIKFFPKIALPSFKLPSLRVNFHLRFSKNKLRVITKKNLFSILGLILLLISGFLIFNMEKRQETKLAQQSLEEIKLKIIKAENLLSLNNKNGANNLLLEAWKEVLSQTKAGSLVKSDALSLKNSIEEKLEPLNNLEKISEPELTFEFKIQEIDLIPQKILSVGNNLYFYNQFSPNLYKLNAKENSGELIKTDSNLKIGVPFNNSVLFFSKNKFMIFENNEWRENNIQLPIGDFSFDYMSIFKGNIYAMEIKSGKIIKYPYLGNYNWGAPQIWMDSSEQTSNAKSMTIDGSIWILAKENSILRYYSGIFQQKLALNFFPFPEDFSKIFIEPSIPYLYILEPTQKRIVVLTKNGEIVKQFQSEKFDNLMDFAVSDSGNTIYLLNGLKIYKINF